MTEPRHDASTPPSSPSQPRGAARPPTTMRAVVQDRYGSADTLGAASVGLPAIAADEVLLEVVAAGVDRGVWHLMTGLPYLTRLMGFGLRRPKNRVPGFDVAGRVVAVGDDVTRFRPGDEVFGIAVGAFAEYAAAKASKLVHKPADLSFERAAVAAISGGTALQAVEDVGRLQPGQEVLVVGASGGVGSYAVQIAVALGGVVTGVCSTAKVEMVRSLGAQRVIDYTREDWTSEGARYDLVVDIGGRTSLPKLRRVLKDRGTLVIVGGEGGGKVTGGFGRQLRAVALSRFVRQRLTMFVAREDHGILERLGALLERGTVVPAIDRRVPLDEVPDAIRALEAGEISGKVVVEISGGT